MVAIWVGCKERIEIQVPVECGCEGGSGGRGVIVQTGEGISSKWVGPEGCAVVHNMIWVGCNARTCAAWAMW